LSGEKTGPNPTDRGKSGVKRSLLTEGHGVPIGLTIEGAQRHDMKLVRSTIESIVVERPEPTKVHPLGMCLDKGYDYDEVRSILSEFGFTAHIRARGEEEQTIKREAGFKARRWVVERAHSWMNRFRRLLVRWDKKPQNYLAFLHFACGLMLFEPLGYSDRHLPVPVWNNRIGQWEPLDFRHGQYVAAWPGGFDPARLLQPDYRDGDRVQFVRDETRAREGVVRMVFLRGGTYGTLD